MNCKIDGDFFITVENGEEHVYALRDVLDGLPRQMDENDILNFFLKIIPELKPLYRWCSTHSCKNCIFNRTGMECFCSVVQDVVALTDFQDGVGLGSYKTRIERVR